MKLPALALAASLLSSVHINAADLTAGMTEGKAEFKSMGSLAFGPDGILFVADTKSAAIVALATGDTKPGGKKVVKLDGLDAKLAAQLGVTVDQLQISDMAVNPLSRSVYFSVARGRGPDAIPVLMRTTGAGALEEVPLEKIKHVRAQLPDAPLDGVTGDERRRSNPRMESITDIAFLENRVMVAGLSNEEFSSTLRTIPFPFKTVSGGTTVEIYHGAHGKFETKSPVRTFVPFMIGKEPELLAAYTCTPLVRFPVNELKPGAKIRGRTIAELGNRNRPLDMIVYKKDGKDFLLLANSSRGVMKINTDGIENAPAIEDRVEDTKGQPYETVADWKGIEQLDLLDPEHAMVLCRTDAGLNLESRLLP